MWFASSELNCSYKNSSINGIKIPNMEQFLLRARQISYKNNALEDVGSSGMKIAITFIEITINLAEKVKISESVDLCKEILYDTFTAVVGGI